MTARADTFNRANSGTLGTPSDGGSAWLEDGAQAGISSNQCVANYSAFPPAAVGLECNTADYAAQLTIVTLSVGSGPGVVVRRSAYTDYIALFFTTGGGNYDTPKIVKVEAGVASDLATCTGSVSNGDVMKLEANGTTITAYKNGVQIGQATGVTFNQSVTKHGLAISSTGVIDDWSGADVSAGGGTFVGDDGGLLYQLSETW